MGLEYSFSLIDITEEAQPIGIPPYKLKNRNFAISIGYNFR